MTSGRIGCLTSATTYWRLMVSLTRSRTVLELGKRLVDQLDIEDDLLASWMAHDIAQKIEIAEGAPAEAKAAAQDACAKAILDLWQYRSTLPSRSRPFAKLEPVLRTLASLDVDRTDYRYCIHALREAATADTDDNTKQWLDLAFGIDYTARLLIQFALRSAAESTVSHLEPWVDLAREAGADVSPEGPIVKFLVREVDESEAAQVRQGALLRERVSRLENFARLASSVAEELRIKLSTEKNQAG